MPVKIRVMIKDATPTLSVGDPPKHRSVGIVLTPEQEEEINLQVVGEVEGREVKETIAYIFLD